ncbi:outer membrane receptor protein involved in Fe transport [Granulicella aggregans]|uniref:Outer membrane receptor protein involved in Fe transport n=1 Tax=Granulicella aggregans TaxID=474949 RepID=A0A7W7ZAP7_9BACT|nr:carboxypeptidase regulatory-like domain-containing protein [Granulicella aggregans]MBB5056317.1 outer membrane receptor protein involved in Fe transport [Granulicella aggregans]
MHLFRPVLLTFFSSRMLRASLLILFIALMATFSQAQSTFGTILGTVKDSTGAVVPGAMILLTNKGTTSTRTATSDSGGEFTLSNIDIGTYSLSISAPGFEKYSLPEIAINARESRRIEAALKLGSETQTVTVEETAQNVITTEVSNLAETKLGTELVSLPVAIYSRSTGSTSPISTLTTEAGVQTDAGGNLSVMGATPALLSLTIDGISSVGVEYSGPINEMFPSFNSIEEIRVSESNNNAEFSGVADITTVSKAGTGAFHGGLFENHQNTVFNAGDSIQGSKPKIIMNDFGGTLGGPLGIPHLYNGRDRTFFFASYEGLRLPRETPINTSVPTLAMRGDGSGYADLTDYLSKQGVAAIYAPDGTPIDASHVPVDPTAAKMLQYLMPLPNFGPADSYSQNYRTNFPSPISTNQGDVRLDHRITQKQSVFARFSYKNRQVISAPDTSCTFNFCQSAGSPLQGSYSIPEIDEGMTFAHNYIFTPTLLNEFRGGFNAQHTSTTQNYSTSQLLQQTDLSVPQTNLAWSEAPQLLINGFMATGGGNPTRQRSQTVELLDNVTWNKGHHNFKFGGDFKRLTDHDDNVFGNLSSGWYVFDGSSDTGATIGDPYASFLAGYPDYTEASTINKPTMDGLGYSYAIYGQDDWKITPRLTLNLGLRYELHPPLKETNYNTAFFLPDYNGPGTDGSTVHGAVVVPNAKAESFESTDFMNAISPTPTLTAQQARLPETLRYTYKNDYGPRIGFAWRPYGNDKMVVRGGWGRFIESPLGFSLVSGWAVHASYVGVYSQSVGDDGVTPQLSLANPFPALDAASLAGTAGFYYAFPIHYKDPSVQQWNMTVEQDLGKGYGLRFSYVGSHGSNLETFVDLNQVPASTTPYDPATVPYTSWSVIQSVENLAESNYGSGTVEVSRRSGKNLTFDASYTFTRDLSDAAGATPSGFAGSGGNFVTDRFHPGLDYGNVSYDRKNRFLVTYLYDLPFGKGQRFFPGNGPINTIIGDWHLGGVTVLQSGAFLTPYQSSSDPANTNILTTVGQTHADIHSGVTLYATNRTTTQWLNPAAFGIPAANQGSFGNARVGSVVGPGTAVFSMSMRKDIALYEHVKFEFSAEAANVFNHRNYLPPNMQVDAGNFGQIPGLESAEGAGPRSLELAGRINF